MARGDNSVASPAVKRRGQGKQKKEPSLSKTLSGEKALEGLFDLDGLPMTAAVHQNNARWSDALRKPSTRIARTIRRTSFPGGYDLVTFQAPGWTFYQEGPKKSQIKESLATRIKTWDPHHGWTKEERKDATHMRQKVLLFKDGKMLPLADGRENEWWRPQRVGPLSRVLPGIAHRQAIKRAKILISIHKSQGSRFSLEEKAAREAMRQMGDEALEDPKERPRYLELKKSALLRLKKAQRDRN